MNPLRIRLDSLEKLLTMYDFKICDLELYGRRDNIEVNWKSYDNHRQWWRYVLEQREKIRIATESNADRTPSL